MLHDCMAKLSYDPKSFLQRHLTPPTLGRTRGVDLQRDFTRRRVVLFHRGRWIGNCKLRRHSVKRPLRSLSDFCGSRPSTLISAGRAVVIGQSQIILDQPRRDPHDS